MIFAGIYADYFPNLRNYRKYSCPKSLTKMGKSTKLIELIELNQQSTVHRILADICI